MRRIALLLGLIAAVAAAQTTPPRVVRATADAVVKVAPDLAKLTVGVVTQAVTAQDAASQNSTQTNAMLTALKQVLGLNADIQTTSYALNPVYQYPQPGQGGTPKLVAYTATNNLEVTMSDLSIVGRVIDAATQAGANNVGGLQFTLKDPEPIRAQALAQAARQAREHAAAIASGLQIQLGQIYTASESSAVRVPIVNMTAAAAAPSTPIETGTVQVTATVTVEVLIT